MLVQGLEARAAAAATARDEAARRLESAEREREELREQLRSRVGAL